MRTSALFGEKNIGVFVIYGVSARTRRKGGWSSADVLRTKRQGVNILQFC